MKVLFVHDHKFMRDKDVHYSNGSFPRGVWERYLNVFDSLTVVGRDGGQINGSRENHSISSHELVRFELLDNIANVRSFLFGNKSVESRCVKLVNDHDAVIARLPSQMGLLFAKEASRQGKPYAVEVVGCAWDALWNHGAIKGKILAPITYNRTRQAVSGAKYALYVTQEFLQQRYPCEQGVTTFCSNVEIHPVQEGVLYDRMERYKAGRKSGVFGLIGNYSSNYKGIDVAIRALSIVSSRFPECELQVVGAGDSRVYSELARDLGVGDRVTFIGSLSSGQAVFKWLDSIDFYLQPSLTEGLPRSLVEAMSRGCPALASHVGGMPELLLPQQMIRPGDYRTLAEKMTGLFQDERLCVLLSEDNFRRAEAYYKNALDLRRKKFWSSFKNFVECKYCF